MVSLASAVSRWGLVCLTGLAATICWRSAADAPSVSAVASSTPVAKVHLGGAYLLLRERRAGATVLDLRWGGRCVPGAQHLGADLSIAALAHKVSPSTRIVVLLGEGARVQNVARLLAVRPALQCVLMVPSPLIEAPDLAGVRQLAPQQFKAQWHHAGSPIILDFSEREEWDAAHLPRSRYIATSRLLSGDRSFVPVHQEVYVSCAVGHRSQLAAQILAREGVRVWNLRGGILAWEAAGLPLERAPAGFRIKDSL